MEQKLTSSRKVLSLLRLETEDAALLPVRPSGRSGESVEFLFVEGSLMTFFFVFSEVNCV